MHLSWTVADIAIALGLAPLLAFGFAGDRCVRGVNRLPAAVRLTLPALLVLPWLIVADAGHGFVWRWFALYLAIPPTIAVLLSVAKRVDPEQRGHWLDLLVLLPLGLAVDLRWLQPAWPSRLAFLGKLVLLDAGLYGFLAIRQLSGVGYSLRVRRQDLGRGLREFLLYAPIAIPLGLMLGFLHLHSHVTHPWLVAPAWIFSFFAVALPEEIFFRGWIQNLLERRIGRNPALLVTACLFGMAHFNKRAVHFNWRYVLLAAIAGIFYGRAWRGRHGESEHRIPASAITHATVDTLWGALLR